MSTVFVILLVIAGLALWLGIAWLDFKNNWDLTGWLCGQCQNPFVTDKNNHESSQQKDRTIIELKERVQILEKIVTEPAYELNKKINNL